MILKRCNKCGASKELKAFHKNKQCKHGRTGTCRVCIDDYRANWYQENKKKKQQQLNQRLRQRKRDVVEHFGNRCNDCGQSFPPFVYEFHHLDPTQKDVNPSAAMRRSEKNMWKELDKCIMVCSNCHKIRHWGESEDRDEATY